MGNPDDVRGRIEELIALSHVVKASDEDVAWLYPDRSEDEVFSSWRDAGVSLVVLTKGPEGVIALAGDHTVTRATRATQVADTIGAGDSFMSGLLVALHRRALLGSGIAGLSSISRDNLEASVDFALECAAITVSRVGANPPTQGDLDARSL